MTRSRTAIFVVASLLGTLLSSLNPASATIIPNNNGVLDIGPSLTLAADLMESDLGLDSSLYTISEPIEIEGPVTDIWVVELDTQDRTIGVFALADGAGGQLLGHYDFDAAQSVLDATFYHATSDAAGAPILSSVQRILDVEDEPVAKTDQQQNPLACGLAISALATAIGLGCAALPVVGAILCSFGVSGGGSVAGYLVCSGNEITGELLQNEIKCSPGQYDRCRTETTIYSFERSIKKKSVIAFWDRDSPANPINGSLGGQACKFSCGDDFSITSHSNSNTPGPRTSYPIPNIEDPLVFDSLFEFQMNDTHQGGPACYVDNTGSVWMFITIDTGKSWLSTDHGQLKYRRFCAY